VQVPHARLDLGVRPGRRAHDLEHGGGTRQALAGVAGQHAQLPGLIRAGQDGLGRGPLDDADGLVVAADGHIQHSGQDGPFVLEDLVPMGAGREALTTTK
jgi:hypothetical protein